MYGITAVLGIVLAGAPFLLGYSNNSIALWTSLIIGIGVAAASLFEYASEGKDRREYYLMAIAGLLAIIAPFIFNFGGLGSAFWMTIGVGALLVITAGSKLFYNRGSFG